MAKDLEQRVKDLEDEVAALKRELAEQPRKVAEMMLTAVRRKSALMETNVTSQRPGV